MTKESKSAATIRRRRQKLSFPGSEARHKSHGTDDCTELNEEDPDFFVGKHEFTATCFETYMPGESLYIECFGTYNFTLLLVAIVLAVFSI